MIADADQARAGEFLNGVTSPDKKFEFLCAEKARLGTEKELLHTKEELLLKKDLLLGPGVREQLLTQIEQLRKEKEQLRKGAMSGHNIAPLHRQAAIDVARRLDPEWSVGIEADGELVYKALLSAVYVPPANNVFPAMQFRKAVLESGPIPPIPDGEICTTYDVTSFSNVSNPTFTHGPDKRAKSVGGKRVSLFVRHCHEDFNELLENARAKALGVNSDFNALIVGTPGIGKSMFALQYLVSRIGQQAADLEDGGDSFDIVYQANVPREGQEKRVRTWAFMRDGSMFYWDNGLVDAATNLIDHLSLQDYYIVDSIGPTESDAACIMVTSPREDRIQSYDKVNSPFTLTMPIFSFDEMRHFRDRCMKGMCTDDDRMFYFLIATFGCSPRNVFGAAKDVVACENKLKRLRDALSKVEVNTVATRLTCSNTDILPHKLFHAVVKQDGMYRTSQTEYASNFAWRLVIAKLRNTSSVQFDSAIDSGSFNASFSMEFESGCIRILSEAKEGRYKFRSACNVNDLNAHCLALEEAKPAVDLVTQFLDAEFVRGRPKLVATTLQKLLDAGQKVKKSREEDMSDILPEITAQETPQEQVDKEKHKALVIAVGKLRSKGRTELLEDIDAACNFLDEVNTMVQSVKGAVRVATEAVAGELDSQDKVAGIQTVIDKFETTVDKVKCGELLATLQDVVASSSPDVGYVEFPRRDLRYVTEKEMLGNAAEFAEDHQEKFIATPVGFASFDAFSLEGLHQITLRSNKEGPGRDPWPSGPPTFPNRNSSMSDIDAWYRIPELWCEMQSAHHKHDIDAWAPGGKVVLPVNYVVPHLKGGGELSRSYAEFGIIGALPRPQTFTDIGEHNVDVEVAFVPRVMGMPRMQDWAGHEYPETVMAQQLKTYEEILEAKGDDDFTPTHGNVQLTMREREYRDF